MKVLLHTYLATVVRLMRSLQLGTYLLNMSVFHILPEVERTVQNSLEYGVVTDRNYVEKHVSIHFCVSV